MSTLPPLPLTPVLRPLPLPALRSAAHIKQDCVCFYDYAATTASDSCAKASAFACVWEHDKIKPLLLLCLRCHHCLDPGAQASAFAWVKEGNIHGRALLLLSALTYILIRLWPTLLVHVALIQTHTHAHTHKHTQTSTHLVCCPSCCSISQGLRCLHR